MKNPPVEAAETPPQAAGCAGQEFCTIFPEAPQSNHKKSGRSYGGRSREEERKKEWFVYKGGPSSGQDDVVLNQCRRF